MDNLGLYFDAESLQFRLQLEWPDTADPDRWMVGLVDLETSVFRGGFTCNICIQDLRQLRELIEKLPDLAGQPVRWHNMEQNIELAFFRFGHGSTVEGCCRFSADCRLNGDPEAPILTGGFRTNWNTLTSWLRQVNAVIRSCG